MDYRETFEKIGTELQIVQAEEANLETALQSVKARREALVKSYNAFAPLVGEQPIPGLMDKVIEIGSEVLKTLGISAAVRLALDENPGKDFTAANMRDHLAVTKSWDWTQYANPLATVHTVMTRLAESGIAKEGTKEGTKCFYSAKRKPKSAAPAVGTRLK
jgi:hypothetical protein